MLVPGRVFLVLLVEYGFDEVHTLPSRVFFLSDCFDMSWNLFAVFHLTP